MNRGNMNPKFYNYNKSKRDIHSNNLINMISYISKFLKLLFLCIKIITYMIYL